MKSRIAIIFAAAVFGAGCDVVPDFMRDAMTAAIKTEVESKIGDAVQDVGSTVLDDILATLAPMFASEDSVVSTLE